MLDMGFYLGRTLQRGTAPIWLAPPLVQGASSRGRARMRCKYTLIVQIHSGRGGEKGSTWPLVAELSLECKLGKCICFVSSGLSSGRATGLVSPSNPNRGRTIFYYDLAEKLTHRGRASRERAGSSFEWKVGMNTAALNDGP